MKYNGLNEKLNLFAKYVFIYENFIKEKTSNEDFSGSFPSAYAIYENRMKNIIYETNLQNLKKDPFEQTKIFQKKYIPKEFAQTKSKENRLLSFCFHLRNSFSHGLLVIRGNRYIIRDQSGKKKKKESARGELNIALVDEFLNNIILDYEKMK